MQASQKLLIYSSLEKNMSRLKSYKMYCKKIDLEPLWDIRLTINKIIISGSLVSKSLFDI